MINIDDSVTCAALSILQLLSTFCPPHRLLEPQCYCDPGNRLIKCEGPIAMDIKAKFSSFEKYVTKRECHLYQVIIDVPGTEILRENSFGNLGIERLHFYLMNRRLRLIQKDAFGPVTSQSLRELMIIGAPLANDFPHMMASDNFEAFNNLRNLEILDIQYSDLSVIPPRAFSKFQAKLKSIDFYGGGSSKIRSLSNHAFFLLPKLERVTIYEHQLSWIPKDAFANQYWSEQTLVINLWGNVYLNEESFEVGSFSGARRPVQLELGDQMTNLCNRIRFLNQKVFESFLFENIDNKILMGGCRIHCGCELKWLFLLKDQKFYTNDMQLKNESFVENRVLDMICKDGKNFWELKEQDFSKCKTN